MPGVIFIRLAMKFSIKMVETRVLCYYMFIIIFTIVIELHYS